MGLFNLGDISFDTSNRPGITNLAKSQYNTSLLRYPIDLGAADKGHYILININAQINSSYKYSAIRDIPTVIANQAARNATLGVNTTSGVTSNILSATKELKDAAFSTQIGQNIINGVNSVTKFVNDLPGGQTAVDAGKTAFDNIETFGKNIDPNIGIRTVKRIADTVALYMPDNLKFTYQQEYNSSLALGNSGLQALGSYASSAIDTYKNGGGVNGQINNAAPFIFNYLANKLGDVGKVLFTAGSGGMVRNPMREILYSSPGFRQFRFDFLLTPRDEKEAKMIQDIIDKLRFHQAPEIIAGSGGFFMYPPSEFDISFYYNGSENPNIPKISTCVLTNIETDYAPNGFAAYEVERERTPTMGRTGMPVAIRLGLSFMETEYIVKGSPLLSNSQYDAYDAEKKVAQNFIDF
jgi:hypothetical protein